MINIVYARTIDVATINEQCDTLQVYLINSSERIDRGEYWFPDCIEYEFNKWNCMCPINDLNANVMDNAVNNYLFQINYSFYRDISGGSGGGNHPIYYNTSIVLFIDNSVADPTIVIRPVDDHSIPTNPSTTEIVTTTTETTIKTTTENFIPSTTLNIESSIGNEGVREKMSLFTQSLLAYAILLTILFIIQKIKFMDLQHDMEKLTFNDRIFQKEQEEQKRYNDLFGKI